MNIRYNEKIMKENCLCEGCNNKKVLKHFEECPKCFSIAYHSTPVSLNLKSEDVHKTNNSHQKASDEKVHESTILSDESPFGAYNLKSKEKSQWKK